MNPISLSTLPASVRLVEVGPRDGLQNESAPITTAQKIALCDRLSQAGFPAVEAGAFVSPKWVPQMADSGDVLAGIARPAGTTMSVLAPNLKGVERAIEAGADEIVIFGAASEAFSRRNINCTIAESIARFAPVARATLDAGLRLRGSVSVAFGCPYEGEVPVDAVVDVSLRMADLGCVELSIADTIGVGTPRRAQAVMAAVAERFPRERIAGHFHDTYGQALANILACLQVGIATFDCSVAGLGGCPYAKGATGNVASEDVLYMLHGMGIETGVDLAQVVDTGRWISTLLQRPTQSRAGKALGLAAAQVPADAS
ncbi:MAG: hydroxymethylglutaryl-CoA lyase [Lautropia sp.]